MEGDVDDKAGPKWTVKLSKKKKKKKKNI